MDIGIVQKKKTTKKNVIDKNASVADVCGNNMLRIEAWEMKHVAESLGALSALVGVTQEEEATREGGEVTELRVHRRCR